MKKRIFIISILMISLGSYAQKKKSVKSSSGNALAQWNNLSMVLLQSNLYLLVDNKGAKKDSILLKKYEVKGSPTDCKITAFTAKGTPLHLIAWSESATIESKERTENKVMQYSEIWNIKSKSKALSNLQTTTKIKEIQYLDKLKNASQTVEKIRNEGLALSLTAAGDVLLKNKTQENTLIYNPSSNIFQNTKDLAPKRK